MSPTSGPPLNWWASLTSGVSSTLGISPTSEAVPTPGAFPSSGACPIQELNYWLSTPSFCHKTDPGCKCHWRFGTLSSQDPRNEPRDLNKNNKNTEKVSCYISWRRTKDKELSLPMPMVMQIPQNPCIYLILRALLCNDPSKIVVCGWDIEVKSLITYFRCTQLWQTRQKCI